MKCRGVCPNPGRRIVFMLLFPLILLASGCGKPEEPSTLPTEPESILPVVTHEVGAVFAIPQTSLDLTGEWRFGVDPEVIGEEETWYSPTSYYADWTIVTVPHTWSVMDAYGDYEGVAWYRKSFTLPEEVRDAHLRLHFEAVFYKAMVWLNGDYLGEHEGGYTPFEFDISHIVDPDGENSLVVRVDNVRSPNRIPNDFFDWWHYGGIVRDVSIEATSSIYIERQRIVAIPQLTGWNEADKATITTKVIVVNTTSGTFDGNLSADVVEDESKWSIEEAQRVPFTISPGERIEVELHILMTDPKLWHFDYPNLYRWVTSLESSDGRVMHTKEDIFGVRLIELKEAKFLLNGEPVRLVGMTRHADSPEYGLAEPVTIMAADYEDMKRLNMVLSRPVHYPQADFILDYCDRNGILLVPEIPAWQIQAGHLGNAEVRSIAKQQLREMILKDVNHPSIWAWSVANEIDSNTGQGHQFIQELVDVAKEIDPTRPVGFASYKLFDYQEQDATSLTDFVFMNEYAGSWHGTKSDLIEALERIHELWPEKVVIISEYGLEAGWTEDWWMGPSSQYESEDYYYIAPGTPPHSEEVYAQRRQVILDQMEIFRSHSFVAGAIFWTYQDYRSLTEFRMGIVDMDRNCTPVWDVIREQYAPILIDGVMFSNLADDRQGAVVSLHTRGPVDEDMPAYTLRQYYLHWAVTSPDGEMTHADGEISLPTLAPGDTWLGDIEWLAPGGDYVLKLSVFRPTGFSVLEQTYDSNGIRIP